MQDGRITSTYLIIKVVIKLARSEEVLSCRSKVILLHGILTAPIIEESNAFPFDIIHLEEVNRKKRVESIQEKIAAFENPSGEEKLTRGTPFGKWS
jgi:hypothetical protein